MIEPKDPPEQDGYVKIFLMDDTTEIIYFKDLEKLGFLQQGLLTVRKGEEVFFPWHRIDRTWMKHNTASYIQALEIWAEESHPFHQVSRHEQCPMCREEVEANGVGFNIFRMGTD